MSNFKKMLNGIEKFGKDEISFDRLKKSGGEASLRNRKIAYRKL